jgi:protease-4
MGMPPMGYPPGMIMMPPPPPRRSGGIGRAIFMTMLVLFLLSSVLLNLILLAGSVGGGSTTVQQSIQSGKADEKIAIIPLKGLIDPNAAAQFNRFLTIAENDKNVKAVVIEIDSPGGTVTASDEIYNRLKRFKAKKAVPIVVSMASLATSGGYYAACGADHVIAQPTTFTGNIGVLMPRYNFSKLMEKYGVEETTIVSTGATFKNAGSSFRPESPEEKAYMQQLADSAFVQFKKVVTQGRNSKLKGDIEEIANGKVYTAEGALGLGLIDQIGYLSDAQAVAQAQAGLGNPTVVQYQEPPSLMNLLMSSNRTGVAGALLSGRAGGNGGPGGVNVTIDANLLHELSTPRPMYLWRGQ